MIEERKKSRGVKTLCRVRACVAKAYFHHPKWSSSSHSRKPRRDEAALGGDGRHRRQPQSVACQCGRTGALMHLVCKHRHAQHLDRGHPMEQPSSTNTGCPGCLWATRAEDAVMSWCSRGFLTVQDMFMVPLHQQHASHTLATHAELNSNRATCTRVLTCW